MPTENEHLILDDDDDDDTLTAVVIVSITHAAGWIYLQKWREATEKTDSEVLWLSSQLMDDIVVVEPSNGFLGERRYPVNGGYITEICTYMYFTKLYLTVSSCEALCIAQYHIPTTKTCVIISSMLY